MKQREPAPSPRRRGRAVLRGLPDFRPSPKVGRTAVSADDAVARGLATAKVYAFASADYPGAALSLVFDSDGTTAVGAFAFDPSSSASPTTAFTFAGGVYQILTVPGSNTSIATGINGAGLMVGVYEDLAGVLHGFANNGGTFSTVDFPGATATQAIGVNDAGQIVGDYFDAGGIEHGFVSSGGIFTAIDYPGAAATAAAGITHGFIYGSGAFSIVDVAGARGTQLIRIKNGGPVTGAFIDALDGTHGLTGQ